ncbi:hypothetical protein M5F00_01275 [Acinetobacter sp. ANC 4945]|uniref:Uncharacterized protein n=1 Tax=Acinetobacter amyesii TaxID=2942470 RepID=A0A1T1H6M4_9GAMM|nr:hypothetical protein [Acinetobacter amyesii]MCL6246505.1 hypothetical protein [Acinetobacter amyesii]OOV85529.1 hypothetical protein B1202_02485 [Acinetobacter amyesii]
MEKFLRLLNPKSINYEADRIDGGQPAMTAQDILLAMSFAKLTKLQDNLIRLKYFGANTKANVQIFSEILVGKYEQQFADAGVNQIYHRSIVLIALTEFCLVPASYVPSVRARALICGWSYFPVHKYMIGHIENVLKDINNEIAIGEDKIFTQVYKIK